MPPREVAFFYGEVTVPFNSVNALQGLINQSLGKSDTATAQQAVSVGALVLQGVLAASMSKLSAHVDVTALDAALAKTLEGAADLERVLASGPVNVPAAG